MQVQEGKYLPRSPFTPYHNGNTPEQIKCDETKPFCLRCGERGVQCPGYGLNVRWSQKHQVSLAAKESQSHRSLLQPSRNLTEVAVSSAPQFGHAVCQDVQQMDLWMPLPSQWDFAMPQQHVGLDNSADALLSGEQQWIPSASWDDPLVNAPWIQDNGVVSPSENELVSSTFQDVSTPNNVQSSVDEITEHPSSPRRQSRQNESRTGISTESAALDRQPISSIPREPVNMPTALSEYFFREVITLYCAWDSKSNAMRDIVETMWQSSGPLHHTIQSMAAAILSRDFPHLFSVAKSEHTQALQLIRTHQPDPVHREAVLLASMLLGHTSSWLNPQNLATDLFRTSCSMLLGMSDQASNRPSLSFFNDTMDYWAMLLAFLTDRQQLGDYRQDPSMGPSEFAKSINPHPYSGISHHIIRVLTDTGILIFGYRKHISKIKFMTEKDLDVFRAALREARRLERIFLAHRAPDISQIKDPGDPRTPLKHLELIDEAYRCTGLLQLYRVFPDLLNERYSPFKKEDLLQPLPAVKNPTSEERQTWLTKLAMHILGILRDIPFESRTRSAQPFILVAVASELKRDPKYLKAPLSTEEGELSLPPLDHASIEVARARNFIGSRLAAYNHILPLRKGRVIFELINQVWDAMDSGEEDVYWLDVAYQKNLGTMMG